ncbi:helix-turn-helix domain-containing protein [Streptomyces sp. NPDC054756]
MTGENQLGEFLRSRRDKFDISQGGVVDNTRRRVKGLRREELALMAGLSPSYYTRIEQGRDRNPSREVLEALARALRLDDTERTYLWSVAMPAPSRTDPGAAHSVRPGVLYLLNRWADLPAFVVDPRRDVLAGTDLAARVNPAWSPGHNLIEFTFLDPRARTVYPDWDEIARQAVAGLRATATTRKAELDGFVADLRERSESFRALWDAHDVYERVMGRKALRVDEGVVLRLGYETFALTGPEGHVLYVYFAEPGTPDEDALRALAAGSRPT